MVYPKPRRTPLLMMIDCSTTSHMTLKTDNVQRRKGSDVPIALGDRSETHATSIGTRHVTWQKVKGSANVSTPDTLVSKDINHSLLSVSAVGKNGIMVAFMPAWAVIINMEDRYTMPGHAVQGTGGLLYISDR